MNNPLVVLSIFTDNRAVDNWLFDCKKNQLSTDSNYLHYKFRNLYALSIFNKFSS